MIPALNQFLYLLAWAGGIFAIGLSLLGLVAMALAGWGWLNKPDAPTTPPTVRND